MGESAGSYSPPVQSKSGQKHSLNSIKIFGYPVQMEDAIYRDTIPRYNPWQDTWRGPAQGWSSPVVVVAPNSEY